MCVLALWIDAFPGSRLIVAANRDEFRGRPSAPPQVLVPGVVGGKDLLGGGTWLGVSQGGPFVAVTNRLRPPRPPNGLSRGVIALEALQCRTLAEVEDLVRTRTSSHPVGGMNLVAVAQGEGMCAHWDGTLRVARLARGPHVVSSDWDIDDPRLPERAAFERHFAAGGGPPDVASLTAFLSSHDGDRPVCKHGAVFGTVSSTIYLSTSGTLLHADGPPCTTPYGAIAECGMRMAD